MIKDGKARDKKKNGPSNGNGYEGPPNSSNSSETRDDKKDCDKPDLKEEPEEGETGDTKSVHGSPLEDIKTSPGQTNEKDGKLLSSSSNKNIKTENGENTDSSFRNDQCEGVMHLGLPTESLHEGVQPLPSNVVNKQPVTMEAQYMQQQSQIFVFSTALANKAAEAVMQGQFASIIAYHCAQPRAKKYLEGQMMPNQCSGNSMNMEQAPGNKQSINAHHNMIPPQHNPGMMGEGIMPSLSDLNQEMGLSAPQPLAGVKIPDENLTPQQRQHREEQLATLRKMHQILFPEAPPGHDEGGNPTSGGNSGHVENPPQLLENIEINKPPTNHTDWHKLQMQFYEEQKSRKNRASGPPPSYQQATRSASVPIALQSPNPSSPNNTTSNLSLPSPRTCSGINSPADKVTNRIPGPSPTMESPNPARNASSNPPTPVSSHLSPKHKDKMNTTNEFSPSSTVSAQNSQQSPVDSLYCRSVQSMGPQKQNAGKEPNLMPVPSPQQIQYLNAFEGQELTIQKQPNTSLKETGRKTPVLPSTGLDGVLQGSSNGNEMNAKVSDSPTASTPDLQNRNYPPDLNSGGENNNPDKGQNAVQQRKMDAQFCNSPQNNNERCLMNLPNSFMTKPQCSGGYVDNQGKCMNPEKEITPGNFPCIGPDNVPLNPNRISAPAANKSSHFDPISSLAQMSQQLTNNVPNSPVNQPNMIPNMHQNMVPFNSPQNNQHMMGMGDMHHMPNPGPDHRMQPQMQPHFNASRPPCNNSMSPGISVSPKMMQGYGVSQRPMPRGPGPMGFNAANIQVKPNAPNTIQYLPSRPQAGPTGPRGPPSLEFLQRFSNPLSNLDAKVPTHNLQYFPNNYPPQNNMNDMGMCNPHVNIRGPMRPSNPGMMRMQNPQQMPPMGFNNPPEVFQNPSNCQIFGPPSKNTSMGLAPDASQPLPPSMGQSNNFKNSTFIGPTTADPNYAQQFHNFQQQLYATNTKNQMNAQVMAGNQHYFVPK